MPLQAETQFDVSQIAGACKGRLTPPGDHAGTIVRSINSLANAGDTDVAWIAEERFKRELATCQAAAVIGSESLLAAFPRGIIVNDPESAIADILDLFYVEPARPSPGVHPTAVVHPTARIGEQTAIGECAVVGEKACIGDGTIIHAGVTIGAGTRIGNNCRIFPRCVIYDRCTISNNVIMHAGVIIGADGFGYIFRDGRHRKLKHLGTVVIEDEVEIGANTAIDRGKFGPTRVCRGAKIDNLVTISHNVQIGAGSIIVAQCGIAGSVQIGSGVIIAGQVGVVESVTIGDGAQLGAKTVARKNVAPGARIFGDPANDARTEHRIRARRKKLPQLFDRVAELEKRVAELDGSADD